jgi:hypothetical protein
MKHRRHAWLVALLAATLLATLWAGGLEEESQVAPQPARGAARPRDSSATKAAGDAQSAWLAQLSRMDAPRERMTEFVNDPFSPTRAQPVPQPPVPTPETIAKPAAPPLPFQYQGLLRRDGQLVVFLTDGASLLIAREGETLAGQYRVERVTERQVVLQYIPLAERQTLDFGRQ